MKKTIFEITFFEVETIFSYLERRTRKDSWTLDCYEKDPEIANIFFNEFRVGIASIYFGFTLSKPSAKHIRRALYAETYPLAEYTPLYTLSINNQYPLPM